MPWRLGSVGQDIRIGGRQLLRSPGFFAAGVATLALGIGSNTTMFSVLYGVLLRPLPFDQPERLVSVWNTAPGIGSDRMVLAPAQYFTYRDENRVFEDLAVWRDRSKATLTGAGDPVVVPTLMVTDGFLSILRIEPILGRRFILEDDQPGGPARVMITYGCWQQRFGGDTRVVGRQMILDGTPIEIIGVLPQHFKYLETTPEMLVPLRFDRATTGIQDFSYHGLARLKPGVTLEQAARDVARMLPLVPQKFATPKALGPTWFEDARMGPDVHLLSQDATGGVGSVLWVLTGTIGMVLLIACANVANLFLVRAEGRRQELAIRSALGAGRARLARALLSESVMLGIAGGVVGVALAAAAIQVVRAMAPAALPRVSEIRLDSTVVVFAVLLSVAAGLLFGLVAVLRVASPSLAALRDGGGTAGDGRGRYRTRNALVVTEIALALVLLISSALMIQTFQALRRVDPGFTRGDEVLTAGLWIPPRLAPMGEPVLRQHQEVIRRIERVPGVRSVGLGSWVSLSGRGQGNPLLVKDYPLAEGQAPTTRKMKWILPGYFETMGTRLVAGRQMTWDDVLGYVHVVLINERLARELWRTPQAALGKLVRESPLSPWREVIGVVGNEHLDGLAREAPPIVYYPSLVESFFGLKMLGQRSMVYAIRSPRAGTPAFTEEIQQAVSSVDRNIPLANVQTLEQILTESMAQTSFALVMLAIAAGVSLLLGVVGIYGVIAYVAAQRAREVQIRVALGAQTGDITRLFVRHGLLLAGLGIGLGVGVAVALSRLMTSLLFGVSTTDPITYVAVSAGLAAVVVVATYLPSRRATRVNPVVTLRAI